MNDVDLGGLASDLEVVLESGAKGSCGIVSQRKRCFWCAAYGLWKKHDISAVVLVKNRASSSPNASVEW